MGLKSGMGFHFEEHEYKSGFLFVNLAKARVSYDTYTMVYHIDITNLTKLGRDIEEAINTIIDGKFCQDRCEYLIDQLINQLKHVKKDETNIQSYQQNKREKRSLDWIGAGFHWAFGLLGADQARDYYQAIEEIGNSTNRINHMAEKHTSLI